MSGRRVVTDAALATRLNSARAAIGDNSSEQRLIKTLQRKGFRFVGAVREVDGEVDTTAANAEAGLFHLSASGTSSHPSGATRAVALAVTGIDATQYACAITSPLIHRI